MSSKTEDEGHADWVKLFQPKDSAHENPERPTVCAWRFTTAVGEGSRVVVERNPYYWKTDPDGRQLPYIDRVVFEVVDEEQTIVLKASRGDLDMHARHINTLSNKPVIASGREEGNFEFVDLVPTVMNEMMIALNLTHEDEALRAVFANKNFRIGLSYAINRAELIETVGQGQGEPWQGAPRPESDFYDEEMAKQYTEFDLDQANEYLDRAGYVERDDDSFRLRGDGERIVFAVDVPTPGLKDFWVAAMELIVDYWAEVGVHAQINNVDRSLFYERKQANMHDAAVWQGDGGMRDGLLDPRWYVPITTESNYATPWADWYTSDGREGQEPVDAVKRQQELYRQLQDTVDEGEQAELFTDILQIAKDEFWAIGTFLQSEGYGIVGNNFHNVPPSMPQAYLYPTPGPTNPEQYFIDEG